MEVDNTQNPVSIGFTPAQGSISGFDSIIDDTLTTILTKGWSKEQLHQAILNLREQVGTSGVQTLLKLLSAHLSDYNNPHKVTIAQIASDVIAQLLNPILPGTPPSTPPIFALYPELPVQMEYLPFAYTGAADANDVYGLLVPNNAGSYGGKPTDIIPHDLVGTAPVIPMITAIDTTKVATTETLLTGTQSVTSTRTGFSGLVADGTSPKQVGFQEVITAPLNTPLTMTHYVIPDTGVTFIILTRGTATIIVDLTAVTALSNTPSTDIGDVERLPNGTYRITHCFTPTDATPITVAAQQGATVDAPVAFTNAQPAFLRRVTLITDTIGPVPPLADGVTTLTKSVLTGTFLDVLEKAVTVSLTLASLPNPNKVETPILVFGGVTVSTTPTGYKIATNTGTSYFLETSQTNVFVRMAFSLSATRLCIKFRDEAKMVITGDFTTLLPTTNTFTLTDFHGAIRDMAIYAEADRDQLLEFLTDA